MRETHGTRTPPAGLRVTVKTGGKRKLSSKLWLERQLNDPYVAQAKARGLSLARRLQADRDRRQVPAAEARQTRGRSRRCAGRLEPDRRQARRLGRRQGQGRRDRPAGNARDCRRRRSRSSISWTTTRRKSCTAMLGGGADVVLSDMAANTTGHRKTDQLRIVGLVEAAAAFACDVLKPGRRFPRQGVPGRRRGRAARAAQARFRQRAPRQAAGEPGGIRRALRAGDGISGRAKVAAKPSSRGRATKQSRLASRSGFWIASLARQ